LRHRLVRLNRDVLARSVVPLGADTDADRLDRARRLDGVIRIPLFADLVVTVHRTDLEAWDDSGYTWVGEVRGADFSVATLIVDNGEITGHVQLGPRIFRIDPVGGAVHRISEIDVTKEPRDGHVEVPSSIEKTQSRSSGQAPRAGRTVIRLLAVYTAAAKRESPNIVNEIKQAVALTKQAYKNSRIPILFVLVKIVPVPNYKEGLFLEDDVVAMHGGQAFAGIRRQRDTLRAHLVALFRISGNHGGVAFYIANPSAATREWGHSSNVRTAIPFHVLAHETGHNMGLHHDRYVRPGYPNSDYNFGYSNCPKRVRTIMAYPDYCRAKCTSCTIVNYFSSPTIRGPGKAVLGIAQNRPGAADNTRRLRETRTGVSQYAKKRSAPKRAPEPGPEVVAGATR
jgi:hypothetical protein